MKPPTCEHFIPLDRRKEIDVIWIGNWGDEERTAELDEFLDPPASSDAGLRVWCMVCAIQMSRCRSWSGGQH